MDVGEDEEMIRSERCTSILDDGMAIGLMARVIIEHGSGEY